MKISILNWNIWSQNLPLLGWAARRGTILSTLQDCAADFICLQEVRWNWMKDLEAALPFYKWTGMARDLDLNSESTPIFYHHGRFTLLTTETFWLSDNPDRISHGWDAHYPRTATCCSFRCNQSQKLVTVVNTHLDHWGRKSRELGAGLIRKKMEQLPTDQAILVAGDLNSVPGSLPCQILMENNFLQDCAQGNSASSWNAWVGGRFGWWQSRLDYIFSRNMEIRDYQLLKDPGNWLPSSDHKALFARLEILS